MNLPISLLEENEAKYALTQEQVDRKKEQIQRDDIVQLDGAAHAIQRKEMLERVAVEDPDIAFERYIGDNDLLPINYLQIGYLRSKAVGRLRYLDMISGGRNAMASCFLITNDLLVTNNHVFSAQDSFRNALVDFDYAYDVNGNEETKIVFEIDPVKFFYTDKNLDFTIVGVKNKDLTGIHDINERGFLILNPGKGKIGTGDFATIIQYPDGGYQQIALRQNQILDITNPDALIYQTDTDHGTSGSPVLNDQWQTIALHSAGVAKKDTAGNYLDKDGNIIPVINKTIDSTKIVWISNTGIRISAMLAKISADTSINKNPYIAVLFNPEYSDTRGKVQISAPATESFISQTNLLTPQNNNMATTTTTGLNVPGVSITININGAPVQQAAIPGGSESLVAPPKNGPVVSPFESKEDDELNADFSAYTGFDQNFMGFSTPIPALSDQLQRQIANLSNSKNYVLKYDHYSTIFHSVRRVPVVSMVNVDGNPAERRDNAPRKDKWMRDNRIDMDIQLTDGYYSKSGFDRGHMTRREDAKWGDTPQEAETAAQITCMYTNACQQVPNLNRPGSGNNGLWGQLEQIVLEKGVKGEQGKTTRICVYNGPIFVDTDPTYKGVQVPMRFYKIVVWLNGAGEEKTTAFVLSQEDLVGGIQFEELQFDKEFIEHQASVAFIENLTGLTFTGIRDFDTSAKAGDKNAVARIDQAGVESLVAGHR